MALSGLSLGTIACALAFGIASPIIGKIRKTTTETNAIKFLLDGLRGSAIVPLGVIVTLPIWQADAAEKLAFLEENFVLVALSGISVIWIVFQDWWRSM